MNSAASEQSVFAGALLHDTPEARASYLDAACGADAALRQRVEVLLRAAEKAGDFLEEPPTGLCGHAGPTVLVDELSERPGDKIGRYRLLQQIGEGGCGVVYMAEQVEPVRRRVAIKVIKLGMDTKSVIARFEAERQALALMDHPNIAKVLDAGATETGRPYFVMELVRGTKITDYCDENSLSTTERLKLFTQVCQAIQHAHQKGIIHRDIKPSNILVTQNESVAVPKVIDFGIAKATTDQRLTDKTVFTAFEQFIGTPAYMSPEQAMMTSLDIDTRADIYALGVLLYELLTGRTPFDAKHLMAVGLDAMRRTILEEEPARPSTRLSTMLEADLTIIAKHRHADPGKLGSLLRGDLDWIVMKALEKDRTRRYETTSDLTADIQRHLDDQPVSARPPTTVYRVRKSLRRNRLAYASATVVLAALIGGLCVAVWGLVREREARHQADAARQQAEAARILASAESARNEQIAKFFMGGWGPDLWRGEDPAVAQRFLGRISTGVQLLLSNQPAAQGDLWIGIGNSYAAINDFPTAITNLHLAVQAYQTAFGAQHVRLAKAVSELGRLHRLNKDDLAARTNAQWSIAIARRCDDPETLADCLLNAAKSYTSSEWPPPEAIPFLREAMQMRRQTVPHLLALIDSTRWLVKALEGLAAEGDSGEAMSILDEELTIAPRDGDLLRLRRTLNEKR